MKTLNHLKLLTLIITFPFIFYSCDVFDNSPDEGNDDLSKGDTAWIFQLDDPALKIQDAPLALGKDGDIYFEAVPRMTDEKARIFALNHDGTFKWKTEALADVALSSKIVVGDDGTLYCTAATFLYSINPADGEINWTWECPETLEVNGQPVNAYLPLTGLALTNNGDLVFQTRGTLNGHVEALFCISPSGTEKWHSLRQNTGSNQITIGPNGMIYSYGTIFNAPKEDYLIVTEPNNGNIVQLISGTSPNNIVYPAFTNNGDLVAVLNDTIKRISTADLSIKWKLYLDNISNIPSTILTDEKDNTYLTPPYIIIKDNETGLITGSEEVPIPVFGVIDENDNITGIRDFIHNHLISTDKNGNEVWKRETLNINSQSVLLADNMLYCSNAYNYGFNAGADKIIALKWDASLKKSGWPRLTHDNRNTWNFNKW